ncbi:MAG TPA: hypothetical protein VG965_04975 [Patescibacteria group bacterium]|nr:hypothetical protein [Patescibacteria group bacterium]
MSEHEFSTGWESFSDLTIQEKFDLYKMAKRQGFGSVTRNLRPRQLFVFAGLNLLASLATTARDEGLIDHFEGDPSIDAVRMTYKNFLPWTEEIDLNDIEKKINFNLALGATEFEIDNEIAGEEFFIGAINNLSILSMPIRNDLGNPYHQAPDYLRQTYEPTSDDTLLAWKTVLNMADNLGVVSADERPKYAYPLSEGMTLVIFEPELPLGLAIRAPHSRFDQQERRVAGHAAYVATVLHKFNIPSQPT